MRVCCAGCFAGAGRVASRPSTKEKSAAVPVSARVTAVPEPALVPGLQQQQQQQEEQQALLQPAYPPKALPAKKAAKSDGGLAKGFLLSNNTDRRRKQPTSARPPPSTPEETLRRTQVVSPVLAESSTAPNSVEEPKAAEATTAAAVADEVVPPAPAESSTAPPVVEEPRAAVATIAAAAAQDGVPIVVEVVPPAPAESSIAPPVVEEPRAAGATTAAAAAQDEVVPPAPAESSTAPTAVEEPKAAEATTDADPSSSCHGGDGGPAPAAAAADAGTRVIDISPAQDGSLRKHILQASTAKPEEDGVTPTDGAQATFDFVWRPLAGDPGDWPDPLDPESPWPDVNERCNVTLRVGDAECCDAVESALASMRRGEICVVRCGGSRQGSATAWTDEALGMRPEHVSPGLRSAPPVVDFRVRLTWCEKEKDVMEMDPVDRIRYAGERKDAAAKYFKAQRYLFALHKYKLVGEVLGYVDDVKDSKAQEEARAIRRASRLNEAACCLKLEDPNGARKACDEVLREVQGSEKALYRRAQAYMKLGEPLQAEGDLKRVVQASPDNVEARRLLQQCRLEAKKAGESQRGLYTKMLEKKPRKAAAPADGGKAKIDQAMAKAAKMVEDP